MTAYAVRLVLHYPVGQHLVRLAPADNDPLNCLCLTCAAGGFYFTTRNLFAN